MSTDRSGRPKGSCRRCARPLPRPGTESFLAKGTGHCETCALHVGRLAFVTSPGRQWLSAWSERMKSAREAAALPEDARIFKD
jgi:hypothetical protein